MTRKHQARAVIKSMSGKPYAPRKYTPSILDTMWRDIIGNARGDGGSSGTRSGVTIVIRRDQGCFKVTAGRVDHWDQTLNMRLSVKHSDSRLARRITWLYRQLKTQ